MTSTILLAYFLQQFAIGAPPPPTYRELRRAEQPGTLSVSVAPVIGGSIPPGAQRVPVMNLTFTASCRGDILVRNVTVQRKGMGDYRDIRSVYVMEGLRRITRAHELQRRDGIVDLRILSLNVPACRTKETTVYVDIDDNASPAGEHRFEIAGPESISAQSAFVRLRQLNELDRREETHKVVADERGEISVEYLNLLRRPTYGPNQTVMRFILRADEVDDHHIQAITLTNEGSARDTDMHNFYLPGSKVTRYMDSDIVRMEFDPPFLLKKNQERLMTLRADVRASRRRTIQFIIEEPSDIEATVLRGRGN